MAAPLLGYDAYAHYGRNLMTRLTIERSIQVTREIGPAPTNPVGIIGAGAGGLYTALMLADLGIPYKVIEARGRVGGRLFTYTFPDGTGAPYNYFDVGAMRYPDTESMKRIFHLFNYGPLNREGISLAARLRPFLFNGGGSNNALFSYNGVTVKQSAIMTADQFNSKDVIQDTSSTNREAYIRIGPVKIVDDVIRPFAAAILKDLQSGGTSTDGWNYMMQYDTYSTRAYMAIAYRPSKALLDQGMPSGPLPTDVINWCETFDRSTGFYDRAFSETVLDTIAFGWNPDPDAPATNWYCVDGGSVKIADAMYAYLSQRNPDAFVFNSRVTAISSVDTSHAEVTVAGGKKYTFSSVVCTIPLPVLRTLDLSGAGLSGMQSAALRDLNYCPLVKIGMQFRSAWWSNANDKDGEPLNIVGGQTYTDRPLRAVVYPSFGTNVQAGTTTTLIASYCWTEDATRLGALIEKEKDLLKELVLKELAYIHNVTDDFLRDQLIDCFAWSWSNDPYTMGGCAFFGPGKFANAYASLNAPAGNGNIILAGEALSVRHAWVEGALDSAWKGVLTLLIGLYNDPTLRNKFVENWGANPEWIAQPPPARSAPEGKESLSPAMQTLEWSKKHIFNPENSLLYRLVAPYCS